MERRVDEPETLPDLCRRLEVEIDIAARRTTDNGWMQIRAVDLQRLFGVFRSYGGRADWLADERSLAMLAAPVRRYIDELHNEIARLQRANAAHFAVSAPLPAHVEALVNPVAYIIDYAAFVPSVGADSPSRRTDRRRARDTARKILELLVRRRCLIEFEPLAEARDRA